MGACNRDFTILLLERGADANIQDTCGRTPLQCLCSFKSGEITISDVIAHLEQDAGNTRYRGSRGQGAWGFVTQDRRTQIKRSLEQEEIFQALVAYGANLMVRDRRGRTPLLQACLRGNSVLAANILFRLGEDNFSRVVCEADRTGATAIHYAAASGDSKTLKVLLAPEQLLHPKQNYWRSLAVEHEDGVIAQGRKSPRLAILEQMEQEERQFEIDTDALNSFMIRGIMRGGPAEDIAFTIGSARRREEESIPQPNISISSWAINGRESNTLHSRTLVDANLRTPLHYVARYGRVGAVRVLMGLTDINTDAADNRGKKAKDYALERDFYDVHSLLEGG